MLDGDTEMDMPVVDDVVALDPRVQDRDLGQGLQAGAAEERHEARGQRRGARGIARWRRSRAARRRERSISLNVVRIAAVRWASTSRSAIRRRSRLIGFRSMASVFSETEGGTVRGPRVGAVGWLFLGGGLRFLWRRFHPLGRHFGDLTLHVVPGFGRFWLRRRFAVPCRPLAHSGPVVVALGLSVFRVGLDGPLAAGAAVWRARGRGSRRLGTGRRGLGLCARRRPVGAFGDPGHHRPHAHGGTFALDDLQAPRGRGGDLQRGLVGLQLEHGLVGLDELTVLLEPADDHTLGDRFAELGDPDLDGHGV